MAKVITKDYLLTQLKNFDSMVLDNKYLKIGEADLNFIESVKLNGSTLVPDSNRAVDISAITGVSVKDTALTPVSCVVDIILPDPVHLQQLDM